MDSRQGPRVRWTGRGAYITSFMSASNVWKNIISEQKSCAMHKINIMNDTANSSCGENQGLLHE